MAFHIINAKELIHDRIEDDLQFLIMGTMFVNLLSFSFNIDIIVLEIQYAFS